MRKKRSPLTKTISCKSCAWCGSNNSDVIDSRTVEAVAGEPLKPSDFGTRRTRECKKCGATWKTIEAHSEVLAFFVKFINTSDGAVRRVTDAQNSIGQIRDKLLLMQEQFVRAPKDVHDQSSDTAETSTGASQ